MEGSALLEVEGLTTEFPGEAGRVPVVEDVSLAIQRGEVLALVGESGCGKSVTALSILRLVPRPGRIAGGSIRLEGSEIRWLSVPEMRQVRGHRISMIFQELTTNGALARISHQVATATA